MTAINSNELIFEEKPLFVPPTSELIDALSNGLKKNFAEVSVSEVDCPDLTAAPYYLASDGLCGSQTILEIGGAPYLLPNVDRSKLYDCVEIAKKILPNAKNVFLCGAGAGPHPLLNSNCEGIFNLKINENGSLVNETHVTRVLPSTQTCDTMKVPSNETKCALLANFYLSEGQKGKVIRVSCKKRTGTDNFIAACRFAIRNAFYGKNIGLGGVFILKNGKVHQHVMRDFSKTPIFTEEELNNWLAFYEMPASLTAVGTFVTDEMGLDLRLQHFHSFSQDKWGGHYHYDTTPDIVEYEAYFAVGERIVRVDKPLVTHQFGRD